MGRHETHTMRARRARVSVSGDDCLAYGIGVSDARATPRVRLQRQVRMDGIPEVGALRAALAAIGSRPMTALEWQKVVRLVDRAVAVMRARGDLLGDVLMAIQAATHDANSGSSANILLDRATRAFYTEP